jgi:hypothetical protein
MSTELISDKLKYHLTEIFKAVADACDGCEDPHHSRALKERPSTRTVSSSSTG